MRTVLTAMLFGFTTLIFAEPSVESPEYEQFERFVGSRRAWATEAQVDWSSVNGDEVYALFSDLVGTRAIAVSPVLRLRKILTAVQRDGLQLERSDLRATLQAGAGQQVGVDAAVGIQQDAIGWSVYLGCDLYQCYGNGAGVFGGFGMGTGSVDRNAERKWVFSTKDAETGFGAFFVGKKWRKSNTNNEIMDASFMGLGLGLDALGEETSDYHDFAVRIPLFWLPKASYWHLWLASRAEQRLIQALRSLKPELAAKELETLQKHVSAAEGMLRFSNGVIESVDVTLPPAHPLASDQSLFRSPALLAQEASFPKRFVRACGAMLGLYGSRSQGLPDRATLPPIDVTPQ